MTTIMMAYVLFLAAVGGTALVVAIVAAVIDYAIELRSRRYD